MRYISKLQPRMVVEYVEDYGDEHFIGLIRGCRILCHKDYWQRE